MCSLNNALASAARRAADAHCDLALLVCDATPQALAAAIKHLKTRGDTRALALLQGAAERRAAKRLAPAIAAQLGERGAARAAAAEGGDDSG